MKYYKRYGLIILVLLFTLLSHLLFLNIVPSGITNDELHFVLNAKSIFLNFSNLANNWHPLSLKTIPNETSSELTFSVLAPLVGPLPLNLFTARLPLALLSSFCIVLLYLISTKLFTKKIALVISFCASINPWFFYVYRTAFDAPIAIFFFLITFYFLITLNKWKLLYTILPISFAFYTYIGTKVLVLPFVFIISIFSYFYIFQKQYLKQFIIINLFTFFLTLYFFLNLKNTSIGQRTSELVTPRSPVIAAQVESQRNLSFNNIFTPIFSNRYTVYVQFIINKWLNSFSPNLLFIKGDDTFTGSLWRHGYFYYLDLLFIFFGLLYLFIHYRSCFFLLMALLIISPLPEIIRKDQIPAYVFHSSLQFPILIIFSGIGLFFLLKSIKFKFIKFSILFIYFLFFVNMLFIYFLQYPFYASESFNFSNRMISQFIIAQKKISNSHIYLFCREPDALFKNYIFYSDILNSRNFSSISHAYQQLSQNKTEIDNISFLKQEAKVDIDQNDIVIVENGVNLPSGTDETNKLILLQLNTRQPTFNIYNSHVCTNKTKSETTLSFKDLIITSSPSSFCQNYFYRSF